MNISIISNSVVASRSLFFVEEHEPGLNADRGVFLGQSAIYKIPFFLDTEQLLNPHLAVLGMTGSGKTYFLRSYLIRKVLFENAFLLVIDWNGEYDDLITFLGGDVVRITDSGGFDAEIFMNGVFSINLSALRNDVVRKEAANSIIEKIIEAMHRMEITTKKSRLIVLDEAWKMIGDSKNLGQIYREGRKYGISVIVSTQLAKDINNEIIANAGTVMIFRLQNGEDYSLLVQNGLISELYEKQISNLPIGSCMVRLAHKGGVNNNESFFIRKINGFSITVYTITSKSDKMQIKISSEQFIRITNRHIRDNATRSKLVNIIEANDRSISIEAVLRFLVGSGMKRAEIVAYLRLLGVEDITIVKCYEAIKGISVHFVESSR